MSTYEWRKSSYSGDGSNCVCVAVASDGAVRLRDSKVPDVLVATRPEVLGRFVRAAADGRFGAS